MSRVAKNPVILPAGVSITIAPTAISVKGGKGELSMSLSSAVEVSQDAGQVTFGARNGAREAWMMAGTTRALVANMGKGVSAGFERKLELVGVGYRASMAGSDLNLTLGFSHPVLFKVPAGVSIETPP